MRNATQPLKDAESVQRLKFGKVVAPTCHGHCEYPILSFTSKQPMPELPSEGAQDRSGIVTVAPALIEKIPSSWSALEAHGLPVANGPYADRNGRVKRLSEVLAAGTDDADGLIFRAMDILRPFVNTEMEVQFRRTHTSEEFGFVLMPEYSNLPDVIAPAGALLAAGERKTTIQAISAPALVLTNAFEPYVLATAALRLAGLNAYPALAVLPVEDPQGSRMVQMHTPIVSILNGEEDFPLRTFALMPLHPNFTSVVLLSDEAVMGVINIILAETRLKQLCADMVDHAGGGREIPESLVDNQLKRIANALFTAHGLWPGSYLIGESSAFMRAEAGRAAAISFLSMPGVSNAFGPYYGQVADLFLASECIDTALVQLSSHGVVGRLEETGNLVRLVYGTMNRFYDGILGYLSSCIEKNQPLEAFEGNRRQPNQ
jgi:hypothetical protein